jgi:L-ascorbate metabolism protein UlaG (beta-lactamase superfamily)
MGLARLDVDPGHDHDAGLMMPGNRSRPDSRRAGLTRRSAPPMLRRVLLAVAAIAMLGGCGGTPVTGIRVYLPEDAPAAGRHVELHYLGNGGWIIRRDADVIATAPFVSNPVGVRVYLPATADTDRIAALVPQMPDVRIMLIGHGHYDHAMDVPFVLEKHAPRAVLYGSETVKHLLAGVAPKDRLVPVSRDAAVGERAGKWLPDPPVPRVRFMPLQSTHAPHLLGVIKLVWWGHLTEDRARPPSIPARWPEGEVLAFLIDFLREDGSVEFRIYYQDTASKRGTGIVPALAGRDAADVDVAILCVGGSGQVEDSPQHIVRQVKPRRVIGGHWEDFVFRTRDEPAVPVFGTSLEDFVAKVHRVAKVPVYIPEPGRKILIPIGAR